MDTKKLLEQVKLGKMSIAEAEDILKKLPYEDLGFAKLDHHRKLRSGFGEVVYCSGKSLEHLVKIFKSFFDNGVDIFGTRATLEQFEAVKELIPLAEYDSLSRIIKVVGEPIEKTGRIAICTGGTSDIAIAEEAAQTAEFFGCNTDRIYDVGVAGIHRLLSKVEQLQ